ncbi:nb-arc and ankyrin domain containing protein [Ilyonectria robusta]
MGGFQPGGGPRTFPSNVEDEHDSRQSSLRLKIEKRINETPATEDIIHAFLEDIWPTLKSDYETMVDELLKFCNTKLDEMDIRYKTSGRVKTSDSIKKSLHRRAAHAKTRFETTRDIFKNLHDLAGIKIVVTFEQDVNRVHRFIQETFSETKSPNVFHQSRKIGQLWTAWFGAYATCNYHVTIVNNTDDCISAFCGVTFEIQLTTFQEDIYNILAHPLLYKQESGPLNREEEIMMDVSHGLARVFALCMTSFKPRLDSISRKRQYSDDEILSIEQSVSAGDVEQVERSINDLATAQLLDNHTPADVTFLLEILKDRPDHLKSSQDAWEWLIMKLNEIKKVRLSVDKHTESNIPPHEDQKICLDSLAFDAMDNRLHDIEDPSRDTCQWLLGHTNYKRWDNQNRSLLWISGKPGSGKSTLMKHAVQSTPRNGAVGVLSFFFHGRGTELQKTPLGFFRSLLYQLVMMAPAANHQLINKFKKRCDAKGVLSEKWQWHEREVRDDFGSSLCEVLKTHPVNLFVDALDECGEDAAVKLVDWFEHLIKELPPTVSKFKICFSCRHYPILKLDYGLEICMEHVNSMDIATYVKSRLSSSCITIATEISQTIIQRASGVFLWAHLVADLALKLERRGEGNNKIQAKIQEIPPSLEELFTELIQELESRDTPLKLIQWIYFASRPLSLDELRWAMAIDVDNICASQMRSNFEESEDFVSDNATMERRIKSLTCGLAETVHGLYSNTTVQFIHQSVKEFFGQKGLAILEVSKDSRPPSDIIVTAHGHFSIFKACMRSLALDEFQQLDPSVEYLSTVTSTFEILEYAHEWWTFHAKKCEANGISGEDIFTEFEWSLRKISLVWPKFGSFSTTFERTTVVHVLAGFGSTGIFNALLKRAAHTDQDFTSINEAGVSPLQVAVEHDHLEVVRLLLTLKKVNVNSRTNMGQTPLITAALRGNTEMVQLLLIVEGLDVNSRDYWGQTPLLVAAEFGRTDIVRLLLATQNIDLNARNNVEEGPLLLAAKRGHTGITQLLLATGMVDVNAQDNIGSTALFEASRSGYTRIVQLLQAAGAISLADYNTS